MFHYHNSRSRKSSTNIVLSFGSIYLGHGNILFGFPHVSRDDDTLLCRSSTGSLSTGSGVRLRRPGSLDLKVGSLDTLYVNITKNSVVQIP